MLGRRLFSAAIIISVMILLIWCDYYVGTESVTQRPGLILGGLAILVAGLAAEELVRLLQNDENPLSPALAVSSTVLMVAVDTMRFLWIDFPAFSPIGTLGWAIAGLTLAFGLTFVSEMRSYGNAPLGRCLNRLCRYSLLYIYLQVLFAFLIGHRLLDLSNVYGLYCLILLITTVKMSDAAAYFVGKSLGRTKFAPVLSPKKTVEGSIGGIFGGIGGAALMFFVIGPQVLGLELSQPIWFFVPYGMLVTVAGMLGDLAESLLKREAGVKDSSSWLPGLGGILDIADSLVFAAPVSFFLLVSV